MIKRKWKLNSSFLFSSCLKGGENDKLNVLTPIYKDYLWGGNKLQQRYNKKNNDNNKLLAESWKLL